MKPKVITKSKVLLFLAALQLQSCGGDVAQNNENINANAIKVGVVSEIFETPFHIAGQSALMARDEINAAGGINGRPLDIIVRDGACNSTVGPVEVENMARQHDIVALVGPSCSAEAVVIIEQVLPLFGLPAVATATTSPLLTTLDQDDLYFRLQASDTTVIETMYQELVADGVTQLAIIHRGGNDVFNKSIAEGLAELINDDPDRTVSAIVNYPESAIAEFSTEVNELFDGGNFDGLAIIGFGTDGANVSLAIEQEMVKRNKDRAEILGVYLSVADASLEQSGSRLVLNGAKVVQPVSVSDLTAPHLSDWRARFHQRFGSEDSDGDPYAYDSMYLIALAMLQGGVQADTSSDDIRQIIASNLRSVSGSNPGSDNSGSDNSGSDNNDDPAQVTIIPGEFSKAASEIASGGFVDYDGATGAIEFDAAGDINYGDYEVQRLQLADRQLIFQCTKRVRLYQTNNQSFTEQLPCPDE